MVSRRSSMILTLILTLGMTTGCQPSEQAIQTAIAETQIALPSATPEPTATAKPFTGADLEPLLFQPGDLQQVYEPQQFQIDAPDYWGEPELYRGLPLVFEGDNMVGHGVEVAVYTQPVDDELFTTIGGMSGDPVEGLGEASSMTSRVRYGVNVTVVWRRCNYVGSIDVYVAYEKEPVAIYARRLDERLAGILCPTPVVP